MWCYWRRRGYDDDDKEEEDKEEEDEESGFVLFHRHSWQPLLALTASVPIRPSKGGAIFLRLPPPPPPPAPVTPALPSSSWQVASDRSLSETQAAPQLRPAPLLSHGDWQL
jgi:hypothetical protein